MGIGSFLSLYHQQPIVAENAATSTTSKKVSEANTIQTDRAVIQPPKSPENLSSSEATTYSSFSLPSLPNSVSWVQETTQPHHVSIESDFASGTPISVTVPAKKWIASTSPSMTGGDPHTFWTQFETNLQNMRWSEDSITISGKSIYGPSGEGTYGRQWSYLRRVGDSLYIVMLGYKENVAGFDQADKEESPPYCPCNEAYEIIISDPIPLSRLGLISM